jgi:hypothetical protein
MFQLRAAFSSLLILIAGGGGGGSGTPLDVNTPADFVMEVPESPIASRPEMQSRNPFYLQNLSMDSYGTFSF